MSLACREEPDRPASPKQSLKILNGSHQVLSRIFDLKLECGYTLNPDTARFSSSAIDFS
jgi:hypothetical protein